MQANINGVGTGGILTNTKGQILLLQRVKSPEANYWSIPGGAIEFGETAEEAAIREFQEETGLACEITDFLGYYDYILHNEHKHWVSLFFVMRNCFCMEPENKEPEKHTQMHWFALENIPDTLTKNTAHAINLYKKWKMKNRQQ